MMLMIHIKIEEIFRLHHLMFDFFFPPLYASPRLLFHMLLLFSSLMPT